MDVAGGRDAGTGGLGAAPPPVPPIVFYQLGISIWNSLSASGPKDTLSGP